MTNYNEQPSKEKYSNCCGANDIYDGNLDNNEGVCADCSEHCEMEEVMREIKFRAWDSRLNEWLGADEWSVRPDGSVSVRAFSEAAGRVVNVMPETNQVQLLQYTGLKDKNGAEIYEGDIIEKVQYSHPFSATKRLCLVRYAVKWDEQVHDDNDWNNDILAEDPSAFSRRPGFIGKEIWNEKGYSNHHWSEFANCEVIGNIYENPELLEANQ